MTAEIIPFPSKLCCQCGAVAPVTVTLIDYDTGFPTVLKFYCREHDPANQAVIAWDQCDSNDWVIDTEKPIKPFINDWSNAINQMIDDAGLPHD